MSFKIEKTGITLIWPPGSGKSTLSWHLTRHMLWWNLHDHDDHGLELELKARGYVSIADAISKIGDRAFLDFEEWFTCENYGNHEEAKIFSLDRTIFASSGSIVRSKKAIVHIRKRTHVILLDTPIAIAISHIQSRPGGAWRIIGMNGWPNDEKPLHETLEEELFYRESLYKKYQDSIFPYQKWESPEETGKRLHIHIMDILR